MGQAFAKRDVQEGIKCFQTHQHEVAIMKWRRALHRIRDKQYRFLTLEYLVTAHAELNQYRDMLAYAVMQIDIANDVDDSTLRVQACLNLARSSEKLCEYHKAISYSRQCIQNKPHEIGIYGAIYLIQGKAYFGLSNFTKALEMLEYAIRISKKCNETQLELLIYATLGHVFLDLKDYDKGLKFQLKAMEAVSNSEENASTAKCHRLISLNLGKTHIKLNRLDQAQEYLEVALRSALESEDRAVQARCLCATAHIHRQRRDPQRAIDYYESAGSMMIASGDKFGQLEVLKGMAKTMETRTDSNVCECKALEYNKKALDIATSIGNKLQMLKCNRHIERLYRGLGDRILQELHSKRCEQLERDLELHCWVCDRGVGDAPGSLELFSCFHIAHQRCARALPKQSTDVSTQLGACDRCASSESTGVLNDSGQGGSQLNIDHTQDVVHSNHTGSAGVVLDQTSPTRENCVHINQETIPKL